jgi:hypothetical protein
VPRWLVESDWRLHSLPRSLDAVDFRLELGNPCELDLESVLISFHLSECRENGIVLFTCHVHVHVRAFECGELRFESRNSLGDAVSRRVRTMAVGRHGTYGSFRSNAASVWSHYSSVMETASASIL